MSTGLLPKEVYEALRDLALDGPESDISPAMVQILVDQGYVDIVDGVPTVTDSGQVVLRDRQQEFSVLGFKPLAD